MKSHFILWAFLSAVLFVCAPKASAQDYSHIRIVRLSFAEGTVQYQRPGEDWQSADTNLPIQEGFALRTFEGYAEVEFEEDLVLRIGTNSTVNFSVLALSGGGRITRLTLSAGSAYVDAKLRHGDAVVIATPQFSVNLPHDGRFRVDAASSESWVSVFHGKVSVDTPSGTNMLGGGHTLHETADSLEVAANLPQDGFDKWVEQREAEMSAAANQTQQVLGSGNYTEGFADLYDYGLWDDLPGYGAGWVPYGMGPGWMPFMSGQWMFMGLTGWNWVSTEPWGWIPYHFGSWANVPGVGWAWLPSGATTYSPGTATWVQVNNQTGWVPNGPPVAVPARKGAPAAAPTMAVLATNDATGVIKPGARIALSQLLNRGALTSLSSPPAPVSTSIARTSEAAAGQSLVSSSFARSGVPPVLRAPSGRTLPVAALRLSATPHAILAPHALPAPAIARGAARGSFRGGYVGGSAFGGASASQSGGGFGGNRGGGSRAEAGSAPSHASAPSSSAGAGGGHH